ncbi:hypothetical protein FOZ62_000725, partial [Perkinsus olseni]
GYKEYFAKFKKEYPSLDPSWDQSNSPKDSCDVARNGEQFWNCADIKIDLAFTAVPTDTVTLQYTLCTAIFFLSAYTSGKRSCHVGGLLNTIIALSEGGTTVWSTIRLFRLGLRPAIPGGKAIGMAGLGYLTFMGLDHFLRIKNDMLMIWRSLPAAIKASKLDRIGEDIITTWDETVRRYGDNVFIIFEGRRMTFQDVDELSNLMCWYLSEHVGLEPGSSCLALVMENKPDFVCWWLAAAKAGVKAAFVNFSLKSDALAYAIGSAAADIVIFDAESSGEVATAESSIRAKRPAIQFLQWDARYTPVREATCLTIEALNQR